ASFCVFFQAEDGIRDFHVTGVQTCALPIFTAHRVGVALDVMRLYAREHRLAETLQRAMLPEQAEIPDLDVWTYYAPSAEHAQVRSEERRVGKEGGWRRSRKQSKQKEKEQCA